MNPMEICGDGEMGEMREKWGQTSHLESVIKFIHFL